MKLSLKSLWTGAKARSVPEKKSYVIGNAGLWGLAALEYTAENPAAALRLYRATTAVSVPINKIAEAIKLIRPVVKRGEEPEDSSDIAKLLMKPSPLVETGLFFKTMAVDFLASANCLLWASGRRGVPAALETIGPDQYSIMTDGETKISEFIVTVGPHRGNYRRVTEAGKRVRFLNATNNSEVFLIRDYNTYGQRREWGESKLLSAADKLKQVILGDRHNVAIIQNGGYLSLLFALKGDLSQEQIDGAKEAIEANYQGPDNAGAIAVFAAEDVSVRETGIAPKDMDFEGMDKRATRAIAGVYQVPIVLIDIESATYNNMREAREMMYDDAVIPTLQSLYNGLEDFLFMRAGLDPAEWEITFDPLQVPALRPRAIEEIKQLGDAGVTTINERRAMLAFDHMDTGGNDIFGRMTDIAIASNNGEGEEDDPSLMRDEVGDDDD